MVLYRSPECWGYAELEQTWKYISTQCWISFHPRRSIQKQIWPCHKNGHGQPRVIIWKHWYYSSTRCMLYTKFQGHRPLGSKEEDLLSFLPYMGMVIWHGTFEQIFIPHIPLRRHTKFGFNRPSGFWAEEVWKCWVWVTLDEAQWMTMTFDIHKGSCTHLVDWIYQLWYLRLNSLLVHYFTSFSYKCIRDQIWPCRKIGKDQGQPRVITWTTFVILEHRLFGSREDYFLKVFIIYRHGGHIGHVT